MKKDNKGVFSILYAGGTLYAIWTSLFFTGNISPLIIVLSILPIYYGFLTFKEHCNYKILAVIGISVGAFCLVAALDDLLFHPPISSEFRPRYEGICFLGNSNTVALLYSDSPGDTYVKYSYDILDKKLIQQTKGLLNHKFNYSRDGKMIVFPDKDDICIMNADGSNMRKLTNHYNSKKNSSEKVVDGVPIIRESNVAPSFSPDGKNIIFVRQTYKHKETEARSLADPDCDIYKIDVKTGEERQLTNYKIDGGIDYPRYFSDGNRLIFGAHGFSPQIYPNNRYFNGIFIINDKNSTLNPKRIHQQCHDPFISFNDKIAFICRESSFHQGENVFIQSGDVVNRLTSMKSYIVSVEISSDGKFIAFEEHRTRDPIDWHFWVMESDGRNLVEIIPPKE